MPVKLTIRQRTAGPTSPPLAERSYDDPIITIGGDPACTLRLDGPGLAPEQAIIINEDGELLFINRAPGTRFNGEDLGREVRRPLADGDTVQIGEYVITFSTNHAGAGPDTFDPFKTTISTPPPAQPPTTPPPSAFTAGQPTQPLMPPAWDNAAQAIRPPAAQPSQPNSFASILDSLRTEEDSFYFEVVSGTSGARRRAPVENAEMLLGWDAAGRDITTDARSVAAPRAAVRKDWSGVVVQPYGPGMLAVNGEMVDAQRRLRNGDRLTFLPSEAAGGQPVASYLVFHEPATLVVLDSLLPQQLPPPPPPPPLIVPAASSRPADAAATTVSNTALVLAAADVNQTALAVNADAARRQTSAPRRNYFGYFSLAEVTIMAFGTLVAAVIIFLILEYV